MVNEVEARALVEADLATWGHPIGTEDEVVAWDVAEHSRAWIVQVATRRWLRTRDFRDVLIGSCPYVVEKSTGELHLYGSAGDEYAKYLEWLDV